ncbi:MAG: DUF4124 domain-containing protein, partial [Candidatus Accumulibacter sp.]|nr:DUF4124 domain-containing protein [Accumulibacter sp.]
MKRLIFLFAALLVSTLTQAQIYQWKDQNGKTIISDKPPADAQAQRKDGGSAASSNSPASEQKSMAEQDIEFRKRRKDAQEKE